MAANIPPKKEKEWYTQNFKQEWLENPELKDWFTAKGKES